MTRSVTPVIDLLAALAIDTEKRRRILGDPPSMTDAELAEFASSGITAMHFAQGIVGQRSFELVRAWLAAIARFVDAYSDRFLQIFTRGDIDRAADTGRVGIIAGVQNSEHFRKPEDVDRFFELGQRISQLTYNRANPLGFGCRASADHGLTEFGRRTVERMNAVGMAIDLSHCGERTTLEAIHASSEPVLITHSNCRALHDHPRCKSDSVIRALAERGGLFGVTFFSVFVTTRDPASIEDVASHVDHLAELVGPRHIAVGSDLDLHGYDDAETYAARRDELRGTPAHRRQWNIDGLSQPRRMSTFADALGSRGFSAADVEGILGGNACRVLGEIWGANRRPGHRS